MRSTRFSGPAIAGDEDAMSKTGFDIRRWWLEVVPVAMPKHGRKVGGALFLTSLLTLSAGAQAQETITYVYDAHGRVKEVAVRNGPVTNLDYDAAGNRTSYKVSSDRGAGGQNPAGHDTGSAAKMRRENEAGIRPPRRKFVVLPLNGFVLVPIY